MECFRGQDDELFSYLCVMTALHRYLSALLCLAVLAGAVSCSRTLPQPGRPGEEEPASPEASVGAEGVVIPDEKFRAWILWNYDTDKDGRLSEEEAEGVTKIELSSQDIKTLDGIQFFPNLVHLHASGRDEEHPGGIQEVDLTHNPKLAHIYLVSNRIRTLRLGDHPDLDHLALSFNALEELSMRHYPKLTLLQVSFNHLQRIDVRGLDELTQFDCDNNPLQEILLGNARLDSFRCEDTRVQTLDFSGCPRMNTVCCTSCPELTTIYLAKGQVLGSLRCDENVQIAYHE